MKKSEFLNKLREELKGYPRDPVEDSIQYYSEMIDDRMEDGMSEEEAVSKVGDPVAIAKQIKYNMPLKNVIKEKVAAKKVENKGKDINIGLIIVLILGAPLWIPLTITILSLVGTFFILLWVFDFVMYVLALVSAVSIIGALVGAAITAFTTGMGTALVFVGSGIAAAGLAILLTIGGVAFAKAIIALTASFARSIKRIIIGR